MTALPAAMAPASYVPFHALALADEEGHARAVNASAPLPVAPVLPPSGTAPLSGTAGTQQLVGPFVPALGRPIWLSLAGEWSGQVQILRSRDGGETMHPLTIGGEPWGRFTSNATEPVAEETVAGATYFLNLKPVSGLINYEIVQ